MTTSHTTPLRNLSLAFALAGLVALPSGCSLMKPGKSSKVTTGTAGGPTLTLARPLSGEVFNAAALSIQVNGTCSANGRPVEIETSGSIAVNVPCTNNAYTTMIDLSSASEPEGEITLTLNHSDSQNRPASTVIRKIRKDSLPATVSIVNPAENSIIPSTLLSVQGACSEPERPVALKIKQGDLEFAPAEAVTCLENQTWSASFKTEEFAQFQDADFTLTARHQDAAQNPEAQVTRTFKKNVTPPEPATALVWATQSPARLSPIAGQWTLSTSADVASQTARLFSDSTCSSVVAEPLSLTREVTAAAFQVAQAGDYYFRVDTTDVAGHVTASACSPKLVFDNQAPVVTIASPDENSFINNATKTAFTVSGSCEAGLTVSIKPGALDAVTTPCLSNNQWNKTLNVSTLSDGTVTFTVSQTDAAGNTGSGSRFFRVDFTNPVQATVLGWQQEAQTNVQPQATWTPSTSPDRQTQSFRLFTGANCSNEIAPGEFPKPVSKELGTLQLNGLADGTYSYRIFTPDEAGNSALSACSSAITVDTNVPSVTISGADYINETNVAAYTASGNCSEPGRSVTITPSSGSAATVTCSSQGTWTKTFDFTNAPQADITFDVTHRDAAGNQGSASMTRLKDTVDPADATSLSWTPSGVTSQTTITASWTPSPDPQLASQKILLYTGTACNTLIDTSQELGASVASKIYANRTENKYTFKVESKDQAGNLALGPCSSSSVEVDLTGAQLVITSPNPGATEPHYVNAQQIGAYSISGTCSEVGQPVKFSAPKIPAGQEAPCAAGGTWTKSDLNLTGADPGDLVVTASHQDAAQNPPATKTVTLRIDTQAPPAPSALAWQGNSPSNVPNGTAIWLYSGSVADVATQTVRRYTNATCSGTSEGNQTFNNNTTASATFTLPEGDHYFQVTTADAAGNTAVSVCSPKREVDLTPPSAPTTLTLTTPAAQAPDFYGNLRTPTFTVAGIASGTTLVSIHTESTCNLNSEKGSASVSGSSVILSSSSLNSDGPYTFYARARDAAGNFSNCSAVNGVSQLYTLDTVAPSPLTIAQPANNSFINAQQIGSVTFLGFCEAGTQLSFKVNTQIQSSWATTCSTTGSWTLNNRNLTGFDEGALSVEVTATDAAGNTASITNTYTKDTQAPDVAGVVLTLFNPTTQPSTDHTPELKIAGVTAGETVSLFTGTNCATQRASGTVPTGQTFVNLTSTSLTPGIYTFAVKETDPAGNTSACSTGATGTLSYETGNAPLLSWSGGANFGDITVGTESDYSEVTVSNTAGSIPAADCSAPTLSGANASEFLIAGNTCSSSIRSSCKILVKFQAQSLGAKVANLNLSCSSGGTLTALNFSGTGVGTQLLSWSESALEFGTLIVNNAITRSVIFRNQSTLPVTCNAPTLDSGSNFQIQNTSTCTAGSLAAGAQCRVDVRATSTSAGIKTDNLQRLCNGTTYPVPLSSTVIEGSGSVLQVVAGQDFSCALVGSNGQGRVYCWGKNNLGQLGAGNTTDTRTPVLVSGITTATAISAGNSHACALLTNFTVQCWGLNTMGQLGRGHQTSPGTSPAPVLVSSGASLSGVTQISAGLEHTCAFGNFGNAKIRCWGKALHCRLGECTADGSRPWANSGPLPSTDYTSVSAGNFHTCGRTTDGNARCWGNNSIGGQLGNDTASGDSAPVFVLDGPNGNPLSEIKSITAGLNHTCARLTGNALKCWGDNRNGEVGDGTQVRRTTPVDVVGNLKATEVWANPNVATTCALTTGNQAFCWGRNWAGQLGDSTKIQRLTPVAVTPLTDVTQLALGTYHTCALRGTSGSTPEVQCWGAEEDTGRTVNPRGEILGDATSGPSYTRRPTPVAIPGITTATQLSKSLNSTCVRLSDGTAQCWGASDSNLRVVQKLDANGVAQTLTGITQVVSGDAHTCALLASGAVECWGTNSSGQLGNNSTTNSTTAVSVLNEAGSAPLSEVTALTAGANHTCARIGASGQGSLRCWGLNSSGQLGSGNSNGTSLPVAVGSLSTVTQLAAGGNSTCALVAEASGTQSARCWGQNDQGQLGDNSISDRFNPTGVLNLENPIAISVGTKHTCVIESIGSAKCWGQNGASGRVGASSSSVPQYRIPVAVFGLTGATQISAAGEHTCARLSSGQLRCWGTNSSGQLGLGATSTTAAITPQIVPGFSTAMEVAAAGNTTCTLLSNETVQCWGDNSQLSVEVPYKNKVSGLSP